MGPWRAGVLILVHVIFAIHIAQWLITGMTVSPVEPSESMETLEHGIVNAGFVFFALAILSTLIFGRFFCGWACHVVALQDLCALLMRRTGVKPKPFRSRLLIFVPLAFGLYMFVWPTFKRLVVQPAMRAANIDTPLWFTESADPHGVTAGFLVSDFWATFPAWYIAIPFLLVCGFASVYFLGAKGFCTYGCPYGGLFAPADAVAPVRIRVTDACEHCGHCTAVCTSNVRVHEEVRDFGMVVDPGCMKCMDCVSVCPNDALYVGTGRPALGARPRQDAAESRQRAVDARRRRYDLTWPEELAFAAIFLLLFISFRGMVDAIPMLMAIGMAGVGTFILHAAWRVIRRPNVRIQAHQLKLKGRIRPIGVLTLAGAALVALAAAWSGHARWHRWQANLAYKALDVPIEIVMRPDFEPTQRQRRRARSGIGHAEHVDAPARGGTGWALDPDTNVYLAYMHLVAGDFQGAEASLRSVIDHGRPLSRVIFQLGDIMARSGATSDQIQQMLEDSLDKHPNLTQVRQRLATMRFVEGDLAQATALHEAALQRHPDDPDVLLSAARFFAGTDNLERARELLRKAEPAARSLHDRMPAILIELARTCARAGESDRAIQLAQEAFNDADDTPQRLAAATLLLQLGRPDAARDALATIDDHARPASLTQAADLHIAFAQYDDAATLLIAAGHALNRPWEQASIARRLLRLAEASGSQAHLDAAIDMGQRAIDAEPESATLRHDQAAALFAAGRDQQAIDQLERACELAPDRAIFPQRLALMLGQIGRTDEAARWQEEADARPRP